MGIVVFTAVRDAKLMDKTWLFRKVKTNSQHYLRESCVSTLDVVHLKRRFRVPAGPPTLQLSTQHINTTSF